MEKNKIEILKIVSGETYNIPIFLEENIDDLGVMVGFDGDISQIEQKCNFTYDGSGNTIRVYNTVNTTKTPYLINVNFTIDWGDGSDNENLPAVNIGDNDLPYLDHTYSSDGEFIIKIFLESPWLVKEIKKHIKIPFVNSFGYPSDLGTLIFTIPYSEPEYTGRTQEYLQDYRELTGKTENTEINFIGVGSSRIDELKKYGDNNEYSGITIYSGFTEYPIDDLEYSGITIYSGFTGYTIDGLEYRDYPDGYTYISGTTEEYYIDEIYEGMITRNEHFLGFIDEPIIYSDIFIERGRLSVMERNFRLSEIESVGELENYGNGYFNVIKI